MARFKRHDLYEYVERVANKSFNQVNFNIIDALILANLSYYRFDFMENKENYELTLKEACNIYFMFPDLVYEADETLERIPFLRLLMRTKRYGGILLFNYQRIFSDTREEQFSAISIKLSKNTVYISYSGTDATFIGFKEDANMSFQSVVPAQISAANYINNPTYKEFKRIYVGGHSKGGNLAVYASANSETQIKRKIDTIFNFDGPGFSKFSETRNIKNIYKKVITIVPDMSVVGMIFNNLKSMYVVESYARGGDQHDLFTWKIDKKNHFVYATYLSTHSKCINIAVQNYVEHLSDEERKKFVDISWQIVEGTKCKDVFELRSNFVRSMLGMIKVYNRLPQEDKSLFKRCVLYLVRSIQNETKFYKDEIDSVSLDKMVKFDYFPI